jgi:hypothetical protein
MGLGTDARPSRHVPVTGAAGRGGLDAGRGAEDLPADLIGSELPMGWLAVAAIFIFVGVIAALNKYEFGRFD